MQKEGNNKSERGGGSGVSAVTRLRKVVSPRVGEKIRGNCVSVAWKWETRERGRRRGSE